jgi:predicted transcriptional regulator YdeE
MQPKIMKKDELIIAGVTGDGNKTHNLWRDFSEKLIKFGLKNKLSDNGYEVRLYSENGCDCHVGLSVSDNNIDKIFQTIIIPATEYAVFEVYVAKGYDSENESMRKWLDDNSGIYKQAKINNKAYVVEYYDERFNGEASESMIEIWVPVVRI